jgi:hypothetical protein
MPTAGEVEQLTGSPFWGSKGEEEGQKEVFGVGGAELRGASCSGRGGQGRRCSSGLGESRGGAALVWGRTGAVQLRFGGARIRGAAAHSREKGGNGRR